MSFQTPNALLRIRTTHFTAGVVFSFGLVLSGMTNPANVVGFLNVASIGESWRPHLAIVMGAALLVYAVGYRLILKGTKPAFDEKFHIPSPGPISSHLIVGSILFGMGWGIGGFCPGPALVSLGSQSPASGLLTSAIIFVGAMFAGMHLRHITR